MTTKRCYRCGVVKPRAEFGRNAASKDGLNLWCKACRNAHYRNRPARPGNQEAKRAYSRAYYANPENVAVSRDAKARNFYSNTSYPFDRDARIAVYQRAVERGEAFCVDHLIALGGAEVKGLLVSWNMRVTTHEENGAKKNSFNPADGLALTPDNHRLFVKDGLSVCC